MDRVLRHGDPADAGMLPERIERVGRLCAGWVEAGVMPALQVLVARHGTIVLDGAWGRLGPEPDAPHLTTDSIFALGSMSKVLTATAVMCLVEDGLLGLNRPVQEYVPEFVGEGKEQVMVHHLLTHTSGLTEPALAAHARARIAAGEMEPPAPLPGLGPEEFLVARRFDRMHDAPLAQPPGTSMDYCSYGYRLLVEIIDRVSTTPAAQFVQGRILDPLGMSSTSYAGVPPGRLDAMVRRPDSAPWAIVNQQHWMADLAIGSGAAYATARDVATFAQMFLNGGVYGGRRILSRASVREMTRDQLPGLTAQWAGEDFRDAFWSYGWGMTGNKKALRYGSLASAGTFTHGGIGMSLLWGDPEADLVGVYLSVATGLASNRRGNVNFDLFANAVTAAIAD